MGAHLDLGLLWSTSNNLGKTVLAAAQPGTPTPLLNEDVLSIEEGVADGTKC